MIPPPHTPPASDDGPLRLLLADDDASLRGGVAELLAGLVVDGHGLEVVEADDIDSALRLAGRGTLHAALLDMYMPGGTGLTLLPRLWELQADLPCIVYSGRWSPALESDALRVGARACLKKPVEPLRLRAAVLAALSFDARSA